jgi:ligand-binding sensor domain-containing protein/signal transduction histidine kinase
VPSAESGQIGSAIRIALLLAVLIALSGAAMAERLPIKSYTTADGLPHNRVKRIVQDSHGFLWFCTAGGLSRFDGYQFTNYTAEDGLPAASFNDLLETSDGLYWAATNSEGIIRFNPYAVARPSAGESAARFIVYPVSDEPAANRVNVLYKDQAGRLWAGTDGGLFYLDEGPGGKFQRVPLGIPSHPDIQVQVWALVEDHAGSLWVGTTFGLLRRLPDGRMIHYAVQPSENRDTISALLIDKQGRLWLGHQSGLIVFNPEQASLMKAGREVSTVLPANARRYPTAGKDVEGLCQTSDGRIWAAIFGGGLIEFEAEASCTYMITERVGDRLSTFAEDRDGNLWITTDSNGALKLTRRGLVNYGEADGLGQIIGSVFEDRAGALYVYSSTWRISRFDGKTFTSLRPNLPAGVTDLSWRNHNGIIQDHTGEWWLATRQGLCRFPKVNRFEQLAQAPPKAVYTTSEGLSHNDVTRLFEDSRGDIWIAAFVPVREAVTRWERQTGSFHRYSEPDGLRPLVTVLAFCEDKAGNVWLGFREGGLARYRDGRFTQLGPDEGLSVGAINDLYLDQTGRLWVAGGRGGICRIDDPTAERPRVVTYTKAEGLASNVVQSITGDGAGRIFVLNIRGIDVIDPATGRIKHYSAIDGLTGGEFRTAFRDRTGQLWFGTTKGLSRLVPEPERLASPPPVFIGGLHIAGEAFALSELGETTVSELELGAGQNNIQIDFFALAFGAGEVLNYQYKLEGANADWTLPTAQRSITYANLAPGAYRFLVRAVSADGTTSESPAAVVFKILPPFWRRWWFIALAVSLVAAGAFAFDRYRVARLKELDSALTESQKLTEQLTEQGAALRKANRSLALEAAVTAIVSESATLNDAAPKILHAVCDVAGWEAGELWELDPQTHALRCAAVWHREVISATDADSAPAPLAAAASSPSAFGFPILLGQEVLGVVKLFTRTKQEPDAELLEMMSTIGGHIGQLIDRKRADEALRKSREERLAELERVRRRIATDLHDDIGSSLTQITILSEVAHQNVGRSDQQSQDALTRIIGVSNELVDAMSDIVWAINPKKDHLSDLLQRMRRFASDILTARNIAFRFQTPTADINIELGANLRREIFLVFKETVNNVVKHSGCSRAEIEFQIDGDGLLLKVSDDGKGFDVALAADASGDRAAQWRGGNGIVSMRKRAAEMGGEFKIVSGKGEGTTSTLRVPISR